MCLGLTLFSGPFTVPYSYPIPPVGGATFPLQRNPFVSDDSGRLLVTPPGSHSRRANSWFLTPSLSHVGEVAPFYAKVLPHFTGGPPLA